MKYAVIILTLTGCANGINNYSVINQDIASNTEKVFIGVPVLLGIEGSAARLDEHWMVTVAHNRSILAGKEVYYHPACDIAVFRSDGDNTVNVGLVYQNEEITHAGYPGLMRPMAQNEGAYIGEVVTPDYPDCNMSASDGVLAGGMSGGGVYNSIGELVGVNHGYSSWKVDINGIEVDKPAIFMSLYGARDWLEEITGNDYFDEERKQPRRPDMMRNRTYRRREDEH